MENCRYGSYGIQLTLPEYGACRKFAKEMHKSAVSRVLQCEVMMELSGGGK
jgi:hypothetical protein